jgi:hypothetical protein
MCVDDPTTYWQEDWHESVYRADLEEIDVKRTKQDSTKEKCEHNFTSTLHMGMLLTYSTAVVDFIDGIDGYRSVDAGNPFHVAPSSPRRPKSCGLGRISLQNPAPSSTTRQHQYDQYNKSE